MTGLRDTDRAAGTTPKERPPVAAVKRGQQNSSGFLVSPEAQEWLTRRPTVARCLWCPGLEFSGTAAEAAVWNQEHRLAAHPERRSMTQRERKSAAKAKAA